MNEDCYRVDVSSAELTAVQKQNCILKVSKGNYLSEAKNHCHSQKTHEKCVWKQCRSDCPPHLYN